MRSLLLVLGLTAVPAVALAEEAPPPEPRPVFPFLGPDGAASSMRGNLTVLVPYDDDADGTLQRLDMEAQYVDAGSGLGGYLTLATSHGDDTFAISHLELGAVARRAMSPELDLAGRLGIVLPPLKDQTGDEQLVAYATTLLADTSDFVTGMPEMTSVRLAVSPTFHQHHPFFRVDAGVDLPVAGENQDAIDPPLHLDLAFGYARGVAAAALEIQTLRLEADGALDPSAEYFHHVALSGQYVADPFAVFAAISTPVIDDDVGFADVVNITLGARLRF